MSLIIDNSPNNRLVSHINKLLDQSEFSRMAVGFFYLSGFEAIREKLNKVQNLKLLIGSRTNQATIEELVKGHLSKETLDKELRLQKTQNKTQKEHTLILTENEYAEDLALMEQNHKNEAGLMTLWELIREKRIDIRVYTKGTLHSKAYIFDLPETNYLEGIAIVGSSNLSISGLSNNSELNVKITNPNDYQEVKTWFENLWEVSEDFNEYFMNVVQDSWFKKQVTPYDIYIKTLYNLVKDRIEIKEYSSLTAFDQDKLFPFQKDAYNRAIDILENQDSPSNGVFVSDVVGLGKSYIAIALISYYWSVKQKASLIICPASLKNMWESYKDEYHLRCKILSSSELYYKDDNESFTLNDLPEYDGYGVVIIDESHNFRNPDSQRYRILAPYLQGKKVVLLTATPQNNSVWDIYHQIKLFHQSDVTTHSVSPNNLKTYFKTYGEVPEKIAELLQNFLIRRTRKDITNSPRYTDWVGKNRFPERKLHTLEYNIDETYAIANNASIYDEILQKLFIEDEDNEYSGEFDYAIYDLTSFLKKEVIRDRKYIGLSNLGKLVRGLLKILLFKRLESSVEAFTKTVERMINRHHFVLRSIERGFVITGKAEQLELFLDAKDDNFDESKINKYDIADFRKDDLITAIKADVLILENIFKMLQPLTQNYKTDDKLIEFLKKVIDKHLQEKVLIFTEFADTANYLYRNLQAIYPEIEIARVSSNSANSQEKAAIVKRFSPKSQSKAGLGQFEKEIQFLITTDVLSEGQNLQDARIVVNYDFHWNPVRLIQRIGRVDRIGSEAETIEVYNFLPDKKLDHQLDLRRRVQRRIDEIKAIFGESGRILSDEEVLNENSVFSIYSDKDSSVLDADDNITTIFDKAENILLNLQKQNPEEYQRIISLKDGVRTAAMTNEKGFYAYLKSGNLHRLYFNNGEKINDNIADVLKAIEANPKEPLPIAVDSERHNESLKLIYEHFKEELRSRQREIVSNQITSEQRYFIERLKATFTLFNQSSFNQKKVDELYKIFSKEIPDYAKQQLRRLKRESPKDDVIIDTLQKLVDSARIISFQEKEKESEQLIIRTICSES